MMNPEIVGKIFPPVVEDVAEGKCPFCGKKIDVETEFRNEISKKEFGISGLCQDCQDEMFGVD